jgi:Lrp/AsnC family leucine-responsive transcriptional regulator
VAFDFEQLLDDLGRRLLSELQANARLSYAELGRRVGLTAPAVAERMRRLEESGVITGYRTEIDPSKLGYPITAFVRVSINGDSTRLARFARELPEVLECHRVTGADCIVLKVVAASMDHLETMIDRLVPYGQPTTSIVFSSSVVGRAAPVLPGDAKKAPTPSR